MEGMALGLKALVGGAVSEECWIIMLESKDMFGFFTKGVIIL